MSKDKGPAFSERQMEQLVELFEHQHELFTEELNQRFVREREITRRSIDSRFVEERASTRAMFQAEIVDIKDRLERIETRLTQLFETEDEDVRTLSRQLTRVKAQIVALEKSIAKLQTASH